MTGQTETSETDTNAHSTSQSPFLTDLQALLDAVESGNTESAQTAANTIVENLQGPQGAPGMMGPPPPPPSADRGQSSEFASDLATLLQAVESGDTESAQDAARALQTLLDNLDTETGTSGTSSTSESTDTQPSFASDVNTPPAKAGGFGLRLKAGSVGRMADY